ncbi:thioredoxin domain-containing protein [Candidatus Gottesmanbacteria bacterium]|nr:thioredoxin domain-containing protein [Candidatus Gottesmanbacteria bacterium]
MNLSGETKLFLGVIIGTIAIIVLAAVIMSKPTPPAPAYTRNQLIPIGANTKGNASASAFLVEFSDFQCPSCKAFSSVVESLTEKYKDKLFFAYRHFPLDQHPFSRTAAAAAEAAGKQGKFFEAGTYFFANQTNFSDEFFAKAASVLALDATLYEKDRNSNDTKKKIDDDRFFSDTARLPGTPTFFLNGKQLILYDSSELVKAVDEAVK